MLQLLKTQHNELH